MQMSANIPFYKGCHLPEEIAESQNKDTNTGELHNLRKARVEGFHELRIYRGHGLGRQSLRKGHGCSNRDDTEFPPAIPVLL